MIALLAALLLVAPLEHRSERPKPQRCVTSYSWTGDRVVWFELRYSCPGAVCVDGPESVCKPISVSLGDWQPIVNL